MSGPRWHQLTLWQDADDETKAAEPSEHEDLGTEVANRRRPQHPQEGATP